jgi:hypothetical protein
VKKPLITGKSAIPKKKVKKSMAPYPKTKRKKTNLDCGSSIVLSEEESKESLLSNK